MNITPFQDTTEEIPSLLASENFEYTKREAVVDCLRQKITTNLLLSLNKAQDEGVTLLHKYNDVREHFIHKLAKKKKAIIELSHPLKLSIVEKANLTAK
jgi:hypothetical protein